MRTHVLRRWIGLGAVALVCATLASCIPAKEPLSDALKAETDKDLIGTWMRELDGGGTVYMIVGRHAAAPEGANTVMPTGLMWFEQLTMTKDGKLNRNLSGAFFVSRIKSERYVNVFDDTVVQEAQKQQKWSYPADAAFWIARYKVQKNTLTVSYPDKDITKELVRKGTIKGTVMMNDDVTLDGGSNLADYLAKEGGKTLFTDASAEKWKRAKIVPAE